MLASPSLLAHEGRPASPEGLAALPTVAMSAVDGRARWLLLGPTGQRHEHQHQPRCTADDMLTLKLLVLGGIGMGVLPDYMCGQEIARGPPRCPCCQGWEPQAGVLHAVFPSRRGMTPAVRRLPGFPG